MARRKSKRKPRRRTKTFNLLNAAEAIAMWNLTTTQLMGIGGLDFFTAGTQFGSRKESGWKSGVNWHKTITFKEIISGGQLGKDSAGTTISGTIMDNAKDNFVPLVVGAIGIPIAFRFGKKVTAKPRRMANNLLKSAGVKELKV